MVEWKKLGEVCTFNRGRTITAKDAVEGEIPVIAGGQTPSYYHNESNRTGESITVAGSGAYAGFISYWNQPIFVSDAFTVDPSNLIIHKYLYHWLKLNQEKVFATQKGAGVPHVHGKDIANFLIPIPSLSEQQRIVGILNTFTSSIDNLKLQIAQRRKQYEYYRDQLLDLKGKEGVEMKEMWELTAWDKKFQGVEKYMQTKIVTYSYLLAKDLFALSVPNGDVKLLSTGVQEGWTTQELAGKNLCEGEVVTIPWGKSPGAKNPVKYYKGKFVTGDNRIATSLNTNVLNNRFLYYWISSNSDLIETYYRGAGIQHPSMFKILTMKVTIPPLYEQQRIVSILDTFEASTRNLEQQLALREKQYEYYRNKLLTFEQEKN